MPRGVYYSPGFEMAAGGAALARPPRSVGEVDADVEVEVLGQQVLEFAPFDAMRAVATGVPPTLCDERQTRKRRAPTPATSERGCPATRDMGTRSPRAHKQSPVPDVPYRGPRSPPLVRR